MRFLKTFLSKSLICCAVLNTSIYAHALLVDDLASYMNANPIFPTAKFEFHEEKEIFFMENHEKLGKLGVQMRVELLTPEKYKDVTDIYDTDNFSALLDSEDKVVVTKHVAVLKNVKPEFFKASNLSHPEYLKHAVSDAKTEVVDTKNYIVHQSKGFVIIDLEANVRYHSFNFEKNEGQKMDLETAERLRDRFPLEENPVAMTTMAAGPEDVGQATYGFRFVNFYYRLNAKDTLLISYNVITIKKEWKFIGRIWTEVLSKVVKGLKKGTEKSIAKVREHFLDLHSRSAEL